MRLGLLASVGLMLAAGSAFAQNSNPCPGEKEYQFNIIGVPKNKNPDMTGNNGHRIFVPLTGKANIYMTGDTSSDAGLQCGNSFHVTDANGTDGDGATLVVPCDPLTAENLDPSVCYDVFATALGKPYGQADVNVVCEFDDTCLNCDTEADSCYTDTVDFSLIRGKGKPVTQDITSHFRADGCIDVGGEVGVCDAGDIDFHNEWIFNIEQLLGYYWEYDNEGLRISQVRFCDAENGDNDCGGGTIVQ